MFCTTDILPSLNQVFNQAASIAYPSSHALNCILRIFSSLVYSNIVIVYYNEFYHTIEKNLLF